MNGEFTVKKSVIVLIASVLAVIYSLSVIICSVMKYQNIDIMAENVSGADKTASLFVSASSKDETAGSFIGSPESSKNSPSDTSEDIPDILPPDEAEPVLPAVTEPSNNITPSRDSSSAKADDRNNSHETPAEPPKTVQSSFKSAVWYTYFELSFSGLNENDFKSKINNMFNDAVKIGTTDIICHVRPFADAYYRSEYFPMSKYVSGTQGKDPGYDPLEYMVEVAHERGLKIHAWINPYRISSDDNIDKLSCDNPAYKWRNDGNSDTDRNVLTWGGKLYFNPGKADVRKLIIDGVREIVEKYDVDGVQIDDYFYPTSPAADETFDSAEYNAYKNASGGNYLSLADWRRANVSALVSGIYSAVHSVRDGVVFGVSPAAGISSNYNNMYADVAAWVANKGYIDYIAPQLYFGYEYKLDSYKFTNLLKQWLSLPRAEGIEIHIGLAAYKVGKTDAGSNEWINKNDILGIQVVDCYNYGCNGVILFSYSTIMDNESELIKAERESYISAISSVRSRI